MNVLVTGATGNVGTAVISTLLADGHRVAGLARRLPDQSPDEVSWHSLDLAVDPIEPALEGIDAVVHLAWAIQPSHDDLALARTNLDGTDRLLDAMRAVGTPKLVYASSVGAYSPAVDDRAVDERWPTDGIASLTYSRHKAAVERRLDERAATMADTGVVRLRFSLVLRQTVASGIARLFLGPLVAAFFAPLPVVPLPKLRFQVVHGEDAARAVVLGLNGPAGAYNIAADDVLTHDAVARALGTRRVAAPFSALRAVASATWCARLQPTAPGWLTWSVRCRSWTPQRRGVTLRGARRTTPRRHCRPSSTVSGPARACPHRR